MIGLALPGAIPGCHGSAFPLSGLSGSGEQVGIVLCIIGLVALTVWVIGAARG